MTKAERNTQRQIRAVTHCRWTGKRVFRKRRDAKMEASRAFNRGYTDEKMETYQCPYCRYYHMTSHPHPKPTPIQEADALSVMVG